MRWLSDEALGRLRHVADRPDLSGTKYELLDLLGRGGMGAVYRARDRELDRHVALKVLGTPDPAPRDAARMLREARTLARLEHPGIVPVHDVGTLPDGRVYYAMKLVRGGRLDEHARATASLGELLRIFGRICEAVAFAHAHGVIHRDLKPENIMVGPYGEVLVMDWGIAKLRDSHRESAERSDPARASTDLPITGHGTVLGTPGYMAPEQARGAVDEVDTPADIFALGAILRFLLTSTVQEPRTEGRAASGTAGAPAVTAGGAPRQVPRPLAAICARAMSPEPGERYGAVDELSDDVLRFVEGLPVRAYREGLVERAVRVYRRYRMPILLVLAYLVMRALLLLTSL
ncbi:MAG: serine/threonine-protein kinase [Gemmatimonadaceae bacterium]